LILFQGAVMDLDVTKSSTGVDDDWAGDVGFGTAAAGVNEALAGTEQNLVPTTSTPHASSGATTADGESTTTETGVIFDGTDTAIDAFINFLVDEYDHDVRTTPCNLILNGTVRLSWTFLGDN